MEPGENYVDVTQFWRHPKTGDSYFCQHGGYCYPSHVSIDGKRALAIKLLNCVVGDKVSGSGPDEDGYELYSVEGPA